jgi:hypothetical protein
VDKLKDTLLEVLKNASNIRELKGNESVTLFVSGGTSSANGRFRVKNNAVGTVGGNTLTAVEPSATVSRRTVLTIQASKSAIDGYAKGKLNAKEFENSAKITTYPGDAGGGAVDGMVVGGVYTGRNRF